jgi:hypothetical protein
METAATKTVEQMSEGFAQPDAQESFTDWAKRSAAHSQKEEKDRAGSHGPREISLKDRPADEQEFIRSVGIKDGSTESAKKSRREDSSVQRAERKLTGAELDTRWRQISAGGNAQWQTASPAFQAELAKTLGGVDNQEEVMQHLAAHPEELHHVKDAKALQAAVHYIATRESMSAEVKQATIRHPDAKEKIFSAAGEIMADRTPLFVKAFVNESEVIGELLYTLSDSTTLNKVIETAKANPGKAMRVLHDMELDIRKALSNEKTSRAKPRAPRPPVEVGGRGAAGDDSTFGSGNFSDFSTRQSQRYGRHA